MPPAVSHKDCLHFFGFSCLTVEGSPGFKPLDAEVEPDRLGWQLCQFFRWDIALAGSGTHRPLILPSLPQLCQILRQGQVRPPESLGNERRKGNMGQGEREGLRPCGI